MLDYLDKVDEVQRCLREQRLYYKIQDVCHLAANSPAPQFYVDAMTALRQYSFYQQGRSSIRSIATRKMYAEIFARYENIVNTLLASGQYVCKKEVMSRVLKQPAPSFYYEDGTALKMYYYILSKKKRLKRT